MALPAMSASGWTLLAMSLCTFALRSSSAMDSSLRSIRTTMRRRASVRRPLLRRNRRARTSEPLAGAGRREERPERTLAARGERDDSRTRHAIGPAQLEDAAQQLRTQGAREVMATVAPVEAAATKCAPGRGRRDRVDAERDEPVVPRGRQAQLRAAPREHAARDQRF